MILTPLAVCPGARGRVALEAAGPTGGGPGLGGRGPEGWELDMITMLFFRSVGSQ
jgi:hypothetical protein